LRALAGLHVHRLPDDELARYRPSIDAVTIEDVARVASEYLRLEQAAIVLVGDADAFGTQLEAAGFGRVVVETDDGPATEGPLEGVSDELGPVDQGPEGPTEGAEEPPVESAELSAEAAAGPGEGADAR
jgi:hypothetical protein